MKEKQEIILKFYREGKSLRKISEETNLARQTVTKYVNIYKEAKEKLEKENPEVSEDLIIQEILKRPKYKKPNRSKRKLTREITNRIDELLLINKKRLEKKQFKQLLLKKDIHEVLRNDGYDIGYTTVCWYVNIAEEKLKETFIKQEYQPGSVCEFDWAEIKLKVGGVLRNYQLALFTPAYSNNYFARVYAKQNTQCFQESHADFFDKIGHVYDTMVYDNMRVAVKRMVGNKEKEATDGLLQLSIYYQFHYRFCNVRKGNEKGHVERGVEFVRRKAFALNDTFSDIYEVNKALEATCDQLNREIRRGREKSSHELFLEEKEVMLKSPKRFSCAEKTSSRVDKYSTICYKTCHYSVPEEYNGKVVDVLVFSNKIVIYEDLNLICEHVRKHGHSEWSLNLNHYLKTLHKKPGALKGSLALSQSEDALKSIFNDYFKEDPKSFIELLLYMKEKHKTVSEIKETINKLEKLTSNEITLSQIKMLENQIIEVHNKESEGKIEKRSLKQISEIMNVFNSNKEDEENKPQEVN